MDEYTPELIFSDLVVVDVPDACVTCQMFVRKGVEDRKGLGRYLCQLMVNSCSNSSLIRTSMGTMPAGPRV